MASIMDAEIFFLKEIINNTESFYIVFLIFKTKVNEQNLLLEMRGAPGFFICFHADAFNIN
jgi:hypothetical protein